MSTGRRHPGGGHEICLTDNRSTAKLFQSPGPHQPCGRTVLPNGFNSREQGWYRSPEPLPTAIGIVVQPPGAATVCEVVQAPRPGRESIGLRLGFKTRKPTCQL